MLRYEKLTVKAQEALQAAQDIAEKNGQQQLEPLHLLAALVAQQDGVVPPLLSRLGVRPEALSGEIQTQIARLPKVSGVSQQYLSEATNQVLENGLRRSRDIQGRVRFRRTHSAGHRRARIRSRRRSSCRATALLAKRFCRR